jgi:energy-coupling factor transport system ATP-binding protein
MSDALIQVKNLSYSYAVNSGKTLSRPALQDINLEIARGTCAALIGVTGSGKSTLIQHLNGLLLPSTGLVIVDGVAINGYDTDMRKLRQRVGMLFQFPETQVFEQTIFADVAFGPRRLYLERREVRARVWRALEQVGLSPHEYAQRSPYALSGGQRRRVALAGVLAMQPDILILDEPGVGLDAQGRSEFYAQIVALRQQGLTIVLVSHDMAEVAHLADRLFVLHQGRLVLQGQPYEIFSQAQTLATYGLAPPPLNALLALLRQRGMAVPEDITTLDQAFHFLTNCSPLV